MKVQKRFKYNSNVLVHYKGTTQKAVYRGLEKDEEGNRLHAVDIPSLHSRQLVNDNQIKKIK